MLRRVTGHVARWYRGYGFIVSDEDRQEYFALGRDVRGAAPANPVRLRHGDAVTFIIAHNGSGWSAHDVLMVSRAEEPRPEEASHG